MKRVAALLLVALLCLGVPVALMGAEADPDPNLTAFTSSNPYTEAQWSGSGTVLAPVLATSADISATVQALVDSVPANGRLVIPKSSGTLQFSGITRSGSSIYIDLGGNTIAPVASERLFDFEGTISNSTSIGSLDVVAVSGSQVEKTKLVLALGEVTTPFAVGDVVKVVSTDECPHRWGANEYVGEYAVIESIVADTSITLQSKLYDHSVFANNIVVGKLENVQFGVENATIIGNTSYTVGGFITFKSARDCYLRNVRVHNMNHSFFNPENLYLYEAKNISVYNSADDTGAGKYGYGISDSGSYGGYIENLFVEKVRHAFTTNGETAAVPGTPDFSTGRTLFTRIVNGISRNASAGAWDTHANAAHITFENCKVYGGARFGQARTPYVRFINPEAYDAVSGIQLSTGYYGEQSAIGCEIINPRFHNIQYRAFEVAKQTAGDGPAIALATASTLKISGGYVDIDNSGYGSSPGMLFNAFECPVDLTIENLSVNLRNQDDAPMVYLFDSALTKCDILGGTVNIPNSHASLSQQFVGFGAATATTSPVVSVRNVEFTGTGSDRLGFVVYRAGDARVHGIRAENVHATSGLVEVGYGNNLAWEYENPSARIIAKSGTQVSLTGTTDETILATIPIQAWMMGATGRLRVIPVFSYSNSANDKTLRVRFGASSSGLTATEMALYVATTTSDLRGFAEIINRTISTQFSHGHLTGFSATTTSPRTGAIDTSAATEIVITGQLEDGGEALSLEAYSVELIK